MNKKCSDRNKIYNEKSKQCIKFNTQHFKKLLADQIKNDVIYFTDTELAAFSVTKQTPKTIVKSEKDDKILKGKEVINIEKQETTQTDNTINTNTNDAQSSSLNTNLQFKPVSANTLKMKNVKYAINIKIAKKLRSYVDGIKDRREEKFISRNDSYCKNKELLPVPIIHTQKELNFTYYLFPIANNGPIKNRLSNFENLNKGSVVDLSIVNLLGQKSNVIKYYENNFDPKYVDTPVNITPYDIVNVSWFNDLNEYMNGLSQEDIIILHTYTWHGDVLVNSYLRKTFDYDAFIRGFIRILKADIKETTLDPLFIPLIRFIKKFRNDNGIFAELLLPYNDSKYKQFKKDSSHTFDEKAYKYDIEKQIRRLFYKNDTIDQKKYNAFKNVFIFLKKEVIFELLRIYADSLQTIINNSPPTKTKMTLYRGTKKDIIFNDKKNRKDIFFKNEGFVSSSIDYTIAQKFKTTSCCLTYITLLPGSKTIWLGGVSKVTSEKEFLLGLNTTYLIRSEKKESIPSNRTKRDEICNLKKNPKKVKVTRVVSL